MEVSEARMGQDQARDRLTKARVTVHTFRPELVDQDVQAGLKIAAKDLQAVGKPWSSAIIAGLAWECLSSRPEWHWPAFCCTSRKSKVRLPPIGSGQSSRAARAARPLQRYIRFPLDWLPSKWGPANWKSPDRVSAVSFQQSFCFSWLFPQSPSRFRRNCSMDSSCA